MTRISIADDDEIEILDPLIIEVPVRHVARADDGQPIDQTTIEEFECVPAVQGAIIADLMRARDPAQSLTAVMEFLESVIVEDDFPRFHEMTHSRSTHVSLPKLMRICERLSEEYNDRMVPTGRSSGSSASTTSAGNGSTGGARRAVSTRSRSPRRVS